MKWGYKILVPVAALVVLLAIPNWNAINAALHTMVANGMWVWLILIVVALVVGVMVLPYIFDYFDIRRKYSMASGLGRKRIPQKKRIEIMRQFMMDYWSPILSNQKLTLVSIYSPPQNITEAVSEEGYIFTTEGTTDKRISTEGTKFEDIFCGWIDCYLGDCWTLDNKTTTKDFEEFMDKRWTKSVVMGIKREGSEVDKVMKDAFKQMIGFEAAKEVTKKREKEEDKE